MKKLTLKELIEEFKAQPDCTQYNLGKYRTCYRTTGNYDWFLLKCSQTDISPEWIIDGLSAEADGKNFSLSYTEHDIILCIYKINTLTEFIKENSTDYEYIKENFKEIDDSILFDVCYNLKPDFEKDPHLMNEKYTSKEIENCFDDIYDDYIEETLLPTLKEMFKDIYTED